MHLSTLALRIEHFTTGVWLSDLHPLCLTSAPDLMLLLLPCVKSQKHKKQCRLVLNAMSSPWSFEWSWLFKKQMSAYLALDWWEKACSNLFQGIVAFAIYDAEVERTSSGLSLMNRINSHKGSWKWWEFSRQMKVLSSFSVCTAERTFK